MPTRRQLANAIRALSMDAVQKANSGHPGMPMGMADIAQVLWADHLKHNPGNPLWPDRDRFMLSNGHGSMLLYSLLHLTGYPLSMQEIANFRQFGSHTAGHPEVDQHLGIETTTGPLGQGLANAVGMALAEKLLASEFNRPFHRVVDHHDDSSDDHDATDDDRGDDDNGRDVVDDARTCRDRAARDGADHRGAAHDCPRHDDTGDDDHRRTVDDACAGVEHDRAARVGSSRERAHDEHRQGDQFVGGLQGAIIGAHARDPRCRDRGPHRALFLEHASAPSGRSRGAQGRRAR